jgi:hypothetical protein
MTETLHVDVAELPVRWVPAVELAAAVTRMSSGAVDSFLLVADRDSGELIRLPWAPMDTRDEFRALSPDGRVLLLDSPSYEPSRRLRTMEAATGHQRWLDVDPDANDADLFASFSPDGRFIAMVLFIDESDDPDLDGEDGQCVVSVLDIASQTSRRLFTYPGFVGFSCGVAWSPNQQLLAATYVALDAEHPEGDFQTVVLALDGTVVTHIPGHTAFLSPASNSAWLDDTTLLCFRESGVSAVNVSTGQVGPVVSDGELLGRRGDRMVTAGGRETTALDGTDVRPWLDISPSGSVSRLHFAAD